jgi:hypothetical protein
MKHADRAAGLWLSMCTLALGTGAWFSMGFGAGSAAGTGGVAGGAARPENDPVSSRAIPVKVDFNRDVRPILSNNCFFCHGPDPKTREAGLRVDTAEGIAAPLKMGGVAVVPGDPAASMLLQRITTHDEKDVMPPVKSGKKVTPAQVEILKRWIEQGAAYDQHWSFNPPKEQVLPVVSKPGWVANPIDAFVMHGLDGAGLPPQGEADKRTLIRRLSLDLTGLPPTAEEIAAFEADQSPEAYEKVVDRLLASQRYGERMATDWLDAARFGDTNGYHIDNERYMWKWREWVIDSFNQNMPFDRFTIEQLAGDMLPADADPKVTARRKLASGFNRNHMINFEGGAIPEEYMHNYLVDRVNTTATVWLGLTMSCAQCHDHKYDPISHEDYYRFYAFFNNVPEKGLDGNSGNSEPFVKFPTDEEEAKLADLLARATAMDEKLSGPMPESDAIQVGWESEVRGFDQGGWNVVAPISVVSTGGSMITVQGDKTVLATGKAPDRETLEVLVAVPGGEGSSVGAFKIEALLDDSLPYKGPGRSPNGNVVLTEVSVQAVPLADATQARTVGIVNALADYSQPTFDIRLAADAKNETGWATGSHIMREDREAVFVFDQPVEAGAGTVLKIRLAFESQFAQHSLGKFRVSLLTDKSKHGALSPAKLSAWSSLGPFAVGTNPKEALAAVAPFAIAEGTGVDLAATYAPKEGEPASIAWTLRDDLPDGQVAMLTSLDYQSMYFHRTIRSDVARKMRISLGSDDAIRLWLDGKMVHESGLLGRSTAPDQAFVDLDVTQGEHVLLMQVINFSGGFSFYFKPVADDGMPAPLNVAKVLRTPAETQTAEQKTAVREYFRASRSKEWRELKGERDGVMAERTRLDGMVPTAMVMGELGENRKTHIHLRGEYDLIGEEVTAGVPHALPKLPEGTPANRLTLAQWLVSGTNPLTARVYVNRLWQNIFGRGLVKTSEDFGLQGSWPSHPELLDWLAVDFVNHGWDIKRAIKQIVTSSTYRQSAHTTPESQSVDPENTLLAHHPRVRLNAEGVRDTALYVSGLMVEKLGGPSVKPYQPQGLWEEMSLDPTGASFSGQVYVQDHGEALYRRTLYLFRKRTVPFPVLAIFDAPNRETCAVRRDRTNTPLQALVVLNETGFVEAARNFAQRILKTEGDDSARLARAFELATSQRITDEQSRILAELLADQRLAFAGSSEAEKLLVVGESPRDTTLDTGEHAAWTMVCSAILNLDQTLVKD